ALDGGPAERVEALNIIVANGRYAAGGWRVASRANPEDGLLDVVVVRDGPLLDLTAVAARLVAGDYLDSDAVRHARARRVRVAAARGSRRRSRRAAWWRRSAGSGRRRSSPRCTSAPSGGG